MSVYILSTMTTSVGYSFYAGEGENLFLKKKITIFGGRNIPSHRSGFGDMVESGSGQPLWVAQGIVTPIKDEDWEILKDHHVFKKHLEKGLVKNVSSDVVGNHKKISKIAASMEEDGFGLMDKEKLKTKVKTSIASMSQEQEFRL